MIGTMLEKYILLKIKVTVDHAGLLQQLPLWNQLGLFSMEDLPPIYLNNNLLIVLGLKEIMDAKEV